MALSAGTRLGPYEIVAPIGAGGMGVVYRAKDARLGRDVAIKVLPTPVADDPDRRARFEREAQAVAALSHPNVIAIFDTGVHEGQLYVVMELLAGQTLRERLTTSSTAGAAAIPVRKAVDIAVQIARGLGAAHDKHIVHRDLKPENIFLLDDGQVKILDFGLARHAAPDPGGATRTMAETDPGMVMGTVGYMAPEQVRGLTVDARADLFAFGAVLYEMVSGRRAFQRDTAADTMSAILNADPPELATTRADVAPGLDRIIRHCLEKNPAERFQTARDAAFALEAFFGTNTTSGALAAVPARRAGHPLITTAVAIALVALTIAAVRWLWPPPAVPLWTGIRLGGPEFAMNPRISPSGDTLAFQAMDGEITQVAVMKPESGDWTILTHARDAGLVAQVAWAPDGNSIYFGRYTGTPAGVFSVPALGGDTRLVLQDAMSPEALADGSLLVVRRSAERKYGLFRFWPDSGRLQPFPIEPAGTMPLAARVFPDGNNAVVLGTDVSQNPSQGVHVYVLELASGSVRRLVTGIQDDLITNVAVARDGQSILASVRSGNLVRVVTIPMNGSGGTSTTLTLMGEGHSELDAGPDGSIYSAAINKSFAIVRFPFRGGHAEQIAALPDVSRMADGVGAAALPDGRIVVASAVKGHPRLMVLETGKTPRALIPTREDTAGPVTAVGARDLAFLIGPEPRHTIAVAEIASGRITRRLPFDKGRIRSLAASPDGRTLYVSAGGVIWSTTASGGGEPRKIRAGDSAAMDPSGRRLVVQVNDTPKVRLFEVEVNGGTEREIALSGPFQLTDFPLFSGAITADGQLMVPLASANSWFFWPGLVNLATGTMTRIPVDRVGDYWMQLQAHDGQVIAGAFEDRAVLWRFQPETVSSPKPR